MPTPCGPAISKIASRCPVISPSSAKIERDEIGPIAHGFVEQFASAGSRDNPHLRKGYDPIDMRSRCASRTGRSSIQADLRIDIDVAFAISVVPCSETQSSMGCGTRGDRHRTRKRLFFERRPARGR